MNIQKLNIEDYKNLCLSVFDEMEGMLIILNPIFHIEYANKAFLNYFKMSIDETEAKNFGDIIGCGHVDQKENKSSETSFCQLCEIRHNFHQIFNKTCEKAKFDIVREYKILDEKLIRHLEFSITLIQIEKQDYALCFIKDLAEKDAYLLKQNL